MLQKIVITPKRTVRFAKDLRQSPTKAERLLWNKLRAKRLQGNKFRRQAGVGRFIPDFLCVEHMLIIELDGDSHVDKKEYDEYRQAWLEAKGFRVLRFYNEQVIEGMDFVLGKISAACGVPHSLAPSHGEGEG